MECGLFVLEPAADALAVGRPGRVGDVVGKVAKPLTQRNTRKPLRCRARYKRVWNWERKALRIGDAMATSFFGSLLSAWRKQLPTRTPGKSVRILLVVLSKPSVRAPLTWYDGSCWDAVR